MTSFIKTQIANQLGRFIKNFERDQLKLSLTKGRFELTDLEFDEVLLTDLIELPTWMRISKVTCNRLYVKIGWRKIQHLPLHIHLDEVKVKLETCPELRTPHPVSVMSMPDMPEMKYRLPHKIIDGAYLTMNSLKISFTSELMRAEVQLLELRTYPSLPEWEETDDIAKGRLKNSDMDETLIFRQLDYTSLKLELFSVGENETDSSPIHLITSAGNARLICKRRLSDATLLNMKVDMLLEQIQLTLSETEMKSTVDFVKNIMKLVDASSQQTRIRKAQRKYVAKQDNNKALKEFLKKHIGEEYSEQTEKRPHFKDARARYYMRHAIWETSQHFLIKSVDLTIVHDNRLPESFMEYRQQARYANASISFHIGNIRADVYPFHLVAEGNTSWLTSHHIVPGSDEWINALLGGYRRELGNISPDFEEDFKALMSTTIIAGIGEMTIYPLVTAADLQSGNRPNELPFMEFTKADFAIPDSVPGIELSRTQYYYAKEVKWPVPKANMFVSVSPMKLSLDANTIDWLTLMGLHVSLDLIRKLNDLEQFMHGTAEPSSITTLMRVECYFPRIFFPKSFSNREERASGIQIQAASIVITNTTVGQSKLVDEALPHLLETNLYANPTYFPNMPADWKIPDVIKHFRSYSQDPSRRPSMFSIEVSDIWAGAVTGDLGSGIALPFLDAFSLRMWAVPGTFSICQPRRLVWGAAIVDIDAPTIRVQLNEYTLKLLADVSDGLNKLGEVGAEHMSLLSKLGCPELGLCLLMQQENVEVSVILQSECGPGSQLNAGDAIAVSNLAVAKETSSMSSLQSNDGSRRGSISSLNQTTPPPAGKAAVGAAVPNASVSPLALRTQLQSTAAPQPVEGIHPVSTTEVPQLPKMERPWWRRGRPGKGSTDSDVDEDTDADASSMEATDTETGYHSDDDEGVSSLAGADTDTEDVASLAQFSWSGVGKEKRRVPLADVPASLLCITLKSLQTFLVLSHGHVLAKLRLGHIVLSETRDMALSEMANLPVQEPDLDVARPEYLDTVLVRFEQGKYSTNAGSPAIMSVVRGLDVKLNYESIKRLQAMTADMGGSGSAAKPLVAKEDLTVEEVVSNKLPAVPLIDIRIMNVQCRLKDAIEAASSSLGASAGQTTGDAFPSLSTAVRDLRFKISGLSVQSQKDGLICVSSVRDEELDEDEDVDSPSPRILQMQLNTLAERKAKLEHRIEQLQARLAWASFQWVRGVKAWYHRKGQERGGALFYNVTRPNDNCADITAGFEICNIRRVQEMNPQLNCDEIIPLSLTLVVRADARCGSPCHREWC
ncbi:UHRF1-binding protein 1-like [Hypsibius exemplaris]|uniref:UHRF1-binding protein 1-like n=1 Tax=Hypsibius exemplaris TaxID=2072580 RepID=A0A9X6NLI5_HYPEX|nr:UHRF1-binding protein 1-like [Hypsibius exemplaris]